MNNITLIEQYERNNNSPKIRALIDEYHHVTKLERVGLKVSGYMLNKLQAAVISEALSSPDSWEPDNNNPLNEPVSRHTVVYTVNLKDTGEGFNNTDLRENFKDIYTEGNQMCVTVTYSEEMAANVRTATLTLKDNSAHPKQKPVLSLKIPVYAMRSMIKNMMLKPLIQSATLEYFEWYKRNPFTTIETVVDESK